MDLKYVERMKKGHYANKCPDAKAKDGKGNFKVLKVQLEDNKKDAKSIRKIRIRHSDLNSGDYDI